jgi:predicted small metal-binding protein
MTMTKTVYCRDVGFDCEAVVRAETEEDALRQVAEHAQTVHNLSEVSDEVVQKVRSVMRDE